jgi:hypothetical protein
VHQVTTADLASKPSWSIKAKGSLKSLTAVVQQLAWLSATFRSSGLSGISLSDVEFQPTGAEKFEISLLPLEMNVEKDKTTCWHPMFQNFVIAHNFPIPERGNEAGLELAFDLMVTLGRIWYPLDCFDTTILKGYSTALVPIYEERDSVQWHFVADPDRAKQMELEKIKLYCEMAVKNVDYESLIRKRTFLALWEYADINLGTKYSGYDTMTASEADVEHSRPAIAREVSVGVGTPGMGTLSVTASVRFLFSNAVKAELKQDQQLLVDQLRNSNNSAAILYDVSTQLGWLVPELHLILHFVLAWVANSIDPSLKLMLEKIPHAKISPPADARDAYTIFNDNGDLELWGKKWKEDSVTLMDCFKSMYKSFSARKDAVKAKEAFGISSHSSGLCGWDLEDIILRKPESSRREESTGNHSGGWEEIAWQNPDVAIFLGKNIGDPIVPKDQGQLCTTSLTAPSKRSYLIASTLALSNITKMVPNGPRHLKLSDKLWCQQHQNSQLFEPCNWGSKRGCYRVQQLVPKPPAKPLPLPSNSSGGGAVLFGTVSVHKSRQCIPPQNSKATIPGSSNLIGCPPPTRTAQATQSRA